jgi:ATP-dependent Clp protease adapter protein ClpS
MNQEKTIELTNISLGRLHKVVLYDDATHSMDEVVAQIQQAIHCDALHASGIMMQAHTNGRAIVITASLERCEHVEDVLCQIDLRTAIEEA